MISHGIYIERVGFSSDFHRSISIAHLLVMGLMCSVYIEALYVKEKKLVFSEQDSLVETGQRQKEEEKPLQA